MVFGAHIGSFVRPAPLLPVLPLHSSPPSSLSLFSRSNNSGSLATPPFISPLALAVLLRNAAASRPKSASCTPLATTSFLAIGSYFRILSMTSSSLHSPYSMTLFPGTPPSFCNPAATICSALPPTIFPSPTTSPVSDSHPSLLFSFVWLHATHARVTFFLRVK